MLWFFPSSQSLPPLLDMNHEKCHEDDMSNNNADNPHTIALVLDPPPPSFTAPHPVQPYEAYGDCDWDEAERIQSHSAATLLFPAGIKPGLLAHPVNTHPSLLSDTSRYSTVSLKRKVAEIRVPFPRSKEVE